jgi:hypothetical protein
MGLCDGYKRTEQATGHIAACIVFICTSQLYVFTDNVHNRERTCIDTDVL